MMKAIVCEGFGDIDVMKIGEVPLPQCETNEILLKVEATALNRADLLQVKSIVKI